MAMEEAQYISTGYIYIYISSTYLLGDFEVDQFYHYGLAASFYTHFTSPIRRYADVIVHRQLLAALEKPSGEPIIGPVELSDLCAHLNRKHRQSKEAQRDSVDLFETMYFKDRNEIHDAAIYGIRNNALLVFLPKFGIKGLVYLLDKNGDLLIPNNALEDSIVKTYSVDQDKHKIVLQTDKGSTLDLTLFEHLTVKIIVQDSRCHMYSTTLIHIN
jgi:DIS3-like exonuclease 1